MTLNSIENLEIWLADMAELIDQNQELSPQYYVYFLEEPELITRLVEIINGLEEVKEDDDPGYYAACVYALDICVAQLQAAIEGGNKLADKTMQKLMSTLATAIMSHKHSIGFWLPVLNAFYEVNVELSDDLKHAYLELACEDDEHPGDEGVEHLDSIRDLIHELADLSVFDIAENFFAQSYAMPPEFFADLVLDLYNIDEGKDVALLLLMHPKEEVRNVVVTVHDQLMDHITLSSQSLSRLQVIKEWYPSSYHPQFQRWIKQQRKKGVIFHVETGEPTIRVKASEVDGSGAQGIFIHLKKNRSNRLCGLLFKQELGIKDAWITPAISTKDIKRYYDEAFDDSVTLRDVDLPYLFMMTSHFLALTIEQSRMPDLHLLEMQEELRCNWRPCKLDVDALIEQWAVQISPFTPDMVHNSFQRSKAWPKSKRFTESWYVENAHIDKLVNQCCSFVEGVKVCRFEDATALVFAKEMEPQRHRWVFHFLWIALWLRAKARKNEKIWQDSFFIAYAIHTGMALNDIPILHEICHQSVVNSIETMENRRTHLNQQ